MLAAVFLLLFACSGIGAKSASHVAEAVNSRTLADAFGAIPFGGIAAASSFQDMSAMLAYKGDVISICNS
jgi:hypothetical protein